MINKLKRFEYGWARMGGINGGRRIIGVVEMHNEEGCYNLQAVRAKLQACAREPAWLPAVPPARP